MIWNGDPENWLTRSGSGLEAKNKVLGEGGGG